MFNFCSSLVKKKVLIWDIFGLFFGVSNVVGFSAGPCILFSYTATKSVSFQTVKVMKFLPNNIFEVSEKNLIIMQADFLQSIVSFR